MSDTRTTTPTDRDRRPPVTDAGPVGLARLGGAAGLFFAASVVVQNVVRGAVAPPMQPGADDLLAYAEAAGTATAILMALFAVNVVALGLFLGAVVERSWGIRTGLAAAGAFGVAGILAMFGLTTVISSVVVARATDLDASSLVALWSLHDAAFAVNFAALALALVALGLAGVAAGITPPVFRWLAPLGGALLLVAGVGAYSVAQGSPLLFVGLVGFLVWLAFVVATGLRLVRTEPGVGR